MYRMCAMLLLGDPWESMPELYKLGGSVRINLTPPAGLVLPRCTCNPTIRLSFYCGAHPKGVCFCKLLVTDHLQTMYLYNDARRRMYVAIHRIYDESVGWSLYGPAEPHKLLQWNASTCKPRTARKSSLGLQVWAQARHPPVTLLLCNAAVEV